VRRRQKLSTKKDKKLSKKKRRRTYLDGHDREDRTNSDIA
jgi:hypothetical protein